jgi:hypothetical protein
MFHWDSNSEEQIPAQEDPEGITTVPGLDSDVSPPFKPFGQGCKSVDITNQTLATSLPWARGLLHGAPQLCFSLAVKPWVNYKLQETDKHDKKG